ncbi:MAG: beta-lactamase family protein [Gammaproteobacteria bacterium]|nr:beta-lactamase family protein [Gammaproteobacteria bacterium]
MMNVFPYDSPATASDVAMDERRLNKVAAQFLQQQQQGRFPGGQLVIRRHGKCVINLACGSARGWRGRGGDVLQVEQHTPFAVFSSGKPMAAIVIALLENRGLLKLDDPLCIHLPELASLGREQITIADVLTHQAGLIMPDLIHDFTLNGDAERLWQKLVSTPPYYPRGTFAYMPIEYGIILDRLCLVLTQQSIAEFATDNLFSPLGLRQMHYGLAEQRLEDIAWNYWLGKNKCMVADMNIADGFEVKNNDMAVFSAKNPAFGMIADASNLAAFYEFLVQRGRTHSGEQLIDASLIDRYTHRQISGWNKSVKTFLSLGHGFMLGSTTPSLFGWWGSQGCFGHPGIFSSLAYADHRTGVSVAIVTNGNKSIGDFFLRFASLAQNIKKSCR